MLKLFTLLFAAFLCVGVIAQNAPSESIDSLQKRAEAGDAKAALSGKRCFEIDAGAALRSFVVLDTIKTSDLTAALCMNGFSDSVRSPH